MKECNMRKIRDGWTFDASTGSVCRFEHFPLSSADELVKQAASTFVVETINFTFGENEETVHRNKYFSNCLSDALGIATKLAIASKDVAEEVVAVRKATPEEERTWKRVEDYFEERMPAAITEVQAELQL